MRTLLLLVALCGCGVDPGVVRPACAPALPESGAQCPAADDGKAQCAKDASGFWLCNGVWSFAACPGGTSCVDTGNGVGCF